jgi:hypothetical protein
MCEKFNLWEYLSSWEYQDQGNFRIFFAVVDLVLLGNMFFLTRLNCGYYNIWVFVYPSLDPCKAGASCTGLPL